MDILKEISHRDFNNVLDPLASATRDQLWMWAKQHGIHFDHRTTPKPDMEEVLRAKGLTNIPVEPMRLGAPVIPSEIIRPGDQPQAATVSLDAERQQRIASYLSDDNKDEKPDVPVAKMTMWQLRVELKKRGIKFSRTDKMETLREILSRGEATT